MKLATILIPRTIVQSHLESQLREPIEEECYQLVTLEDYQKLKRHADRMATSATLYDGLVNRAVEPSHNIALANAIDDYIINYNPRMECGL